MKLISSRVERYPKSLVIRALLQLVPLGIGGAVDTLAVGTIDKMNEARIRAFFDELAGSTVALDESLLESSDFLHCYFSTVKHVLNTRREEKIKMFARLLSNATAEISPSDIEEFEDILKILDELSYRELAALAILDGFSSTKRLS